MHTKITAERRVLNLLALTCFARPLTVFISLSAILPTSIGFRLHIKLLPSYLSPRCMFQLVSDFVALDVLN